MWYVQMYSYLNALNFSSFYNSLDNFPPDAGGLSVYTRILISYQL